MRTRTEFKKTILDKMKAMPASEDVQKILLASILEAVLDIRGLLAEGGNK